MDIGQKAFDEAAAEYDNARTALIPDYDTLYVTAIAALPFEHADAVKVIDLGAGTGGLTALIGDAFPNARITLMDISENMLDQARNKFHGQTRYTFRHGDIGTGAYGMDLDAVVSSLAIHHLEHDAKRAVFEHAFNALKPGGTFVNVDQFAARSPAIHAALVARWLGDALANGATETEIASAVERMNLLDRNAPMELQFQWLETTGFVDVDILYRNYFWAVFTATKPQSPV